MKLIGYIRVSTEEQAKSGLGLESQRAKIEAYAALYGHELVGVINDDGFSAKSLKRPGIQTALASLSRGEAAGLLVFKLDRLTRSVSDMGGLIDKYFGEKAGKALVSVSDQIDTTTAGGRLVLNVLVSVSQWEREAIGERTAAALEAKASRGERKGGQAPLGKQWAEKSHVECEQEARAVKLIRELRDTGMSIRDIVSELNRRGVPVVRKGKQWHVTTIQRIVSRAC
jgi:site-specific DNA recombinase